MANCSYYVIFYKNVSPGFTEFLLSLDIDMFCFIWIEYTFCTLYLKSFHGCWSIFPLYQEKLEKKDWNFFQLHMILKYIFENVLYFFLWIERENSFWKKKAICIRLKNSFFFFKDIQNIYFWSDLGMFFSLNRLSWSGLCQ